MHRVLDWQSIRAIGSSQFFRSGNALTAGQVPKPDRSLGQGLDDEDSERRANRANDGAEANPGEHKELNRQNLP